ncbi:hypothetical protein T4A_7163 [Trichinella pseudospiralis]|uniref:Uncharacterized protein n=1 Tax=Trichinella pseudospiralis TaxID=6337 RepID=A0A0V1DTJ7_TRIPS|nr:hypothetical protein T4A_7163 [Trichinella pseudospiralis]
MRCTVKRRTSVGQFYALSFFILHQQHFIGQLLSLLPFHPEYTWSTTIMLFHTIFNYRLVAFDIVMPVLHAYEFTDLYNHIEQYEAVGWQQLIEEDSHPHNNFDIFFCECNNWKD